MKIVVVSDSHKNEMVLNEILSANPDADYYFHLGDSEMYLEDIKPFVSVKGNVDFDYNLPSDRVVDTSLLSIYMCHGNLYYSDPRLIAEAAKENKCKIALFGHTHEFYSQIINDIYVINPGSCSRSKDGHNSYVIINIDDKIDVKRIIL